MNEEKNKVTWKGWLSLAFLCVSFSGIFAKDPNFIKEMFILKNIGFIQAIDFTFLKAFDFTVLVGKFGTIAGSKNIFQGAGGTGAREGLLFTITLIPTVMLALGLIQVCESLGALSAAEKLFRPILRPIMGIPGVAGLAFVSSFTSSDVGSVMTRELVDEGKMTDDERTIFVAYQYAGSATVANTFGTGAPLLPISLLPVGIIIALIVLVKIIGAILVRIYLKAYRSRNPIEEGVN